MPPRLANETAPRVTLLALGEGGGPGESPAPGWASLCRLVSAAHQSGGRGVPAVTPDLVADHADGLVVLLGPPSDVGRAIAARRPDRAAAALTRWRERAETVIEIVDHHGPGDTGNAARMLRLAREAGVPAAPTNAVRYLEPADAPVAQVLDAARQLVPLGRRHLAGQCAGPSEGQRADGPRRSADLRLGLLPRPALLPRPVRRPGPPAARRHRRAGPAVLPQPGR